MNVKDPGASGYWRRVGTLLSGTSVAQLIPIAAMPVLSRLFSPAEYGILAIMVALFTVLGVAASGRFEFAIVLPKHDQDAYAVASLAIIVSIGFSVLVGVVLAVFSADVALVLGAPRIRSMLFLVPVVVAFTGIYNTLRFLANRFDQYRTIANAEILKTLTLTLTQMVLGTIGLGASGLTIGYAFGHTVSSVPLFRQAKALARSGTTNGPELRRQLRRYWKFPVLSLPAAVANSMAVHLTNLLIGARYAVADLGQYSMTQRVLGLPSAIVGTAVGQAFYRQATKEMHEKGRSTSIYDRTTLVLAALATPAFIVIAVIAPGLFGWVLGAEWRVAGEYARILAPLYAVRLIVSAVSMTTAVHERQGIALVWQIGLLCLAFASVFVATALEMEFSGFLTVYSVVTTVHYVTLYFIMRSISKGANR